MVQNDIEQNEIKDQTTEPTEQQTIENELTEEAVFEDITQEQPPVEESKADATSAPSGSEWQDRYIRLVAEFDNFKKRTNKEKESLIKFANEDLISSFLPLFDDLDRALRAAETATNIESLQEGLSIVHKKFSKALERQGIVEVPAKNEPFDSEVHEAVTSMPAPTPEQKGTVLEVIEKGFRFHGKVIRFAKVITAE